MRFWIGVASKEHIEIGKNGGFCQLCHGKAAPLKRMKESDFIIYYSPKISLSDKKPYQKFTAIGEILNNEVYQVQMFENFYPHRKDVLFFKSSEALILPLISALDFIDNKTNWGYKFRFGHLEISQDDFLKIASCMLNDFDLNKIKEKICK